jgi:hypothetical protein
MFLLLTTGEVIVLSPFLKAAFDSHRRAVRRLYDVPFFEADLVL